MAFSEIRRQRIRQLLFFFGEDRIFLIVSVKPTAIFLQNYLSRHLFLVKLVSGHSQHTFYQSCSALNNINTFETTEQHAYRRIRLNN